jgi:hypothetical protein
MPLSSLLCKLALIKAYLNFNSKNRGALENVERNVLRIRTLTLSWNDTTFYGKHLNSNWTWWQKQNMHSSLCEQKQVLMPENRNNKTREKLPCS